MSELDKSGFELVTVGEQASKPWSLQILKSVYPRNSDHAVHTVMDSDHKDQIPARSFDWGGC